MILNKAFKVLLVMGIVFTNLLFVFPSFSDHFRVHAANFTMQSGYYVGDGVDNRGITGLGISPDLVMIKDHNGNGNDGIIFKTTTMAGEITSKLTDPDVDVATDAIQSLDSNGFTLGTYADANAANVVFRYTAFDGSDCSATGTFCVGSYTGNGAATQAITSVGFQPNLIIVKGSNAIRAVFITSNMAANTTQFFDAVNQDVTGTMLKTLDATGFTVGNSANTNTAATTYWYAAFKVSAGAFSVGTYTGTGAAFSVTGVGFQPSFLSIKVSTGAAARSAMMKSPEIIGNVAARMDDNTEVLAAVTSLDVDGFTLGTAVDTNESTRTVYWMAWGVNVAVSSGSGTYKMATGTYTGNGTTQSITGLGFTPDLIMVKSFSTVQQTVLRTRLMKGDLSIEPANAAVGFTGGVTTLDADGFSVGNAASVNANTIVFHWQAFGNAYNPETNLGATDFAIGVYVGSGSDNSNITRMNFQPDLVALRTSGAGSGVIRTSAFAGDVSTFFANVAEAADNIQAFSTNGFQIGLQTRVNNSNVPYYWFAFKAGPDMKVGSYAGTGAAQNINVIIQPGLIWVKRITAARGIFRPNTFVGDTTAYFDALANVTTRITAILTNGFSVGTGAEANAAATTFRYAVWKSPTTYTQNDFEWFVTTGSMVLVNAWPPGTGADLIENQVMLPIPFYEPLKSGDQIRIQMNLTVGQSLLGLSQQAFTLQFSAASNCTTAVSWTDVGAVGSGAIWRLFDEAALAANAPQSNQISTSTAGQEGSYSETNPSGTNTLTVSVGSNTEWDWPVQNNGAASNSTYCFRMVKGGGVALDSYNADSYPKLTTAATTADLMRHGNFFSGGTEQTFFWAN